MKLHPVNTEKIRENRSLSFTTTREEHVSQSRRLSSLFNIEDYLKDEDFDLRPKTDYTYAYSGSYCRSKPDKDVVSPNMSRRRLRARESMSEDLSSVSRSSYLDEQNMSRYRNEELSDDELMESADEQDFLQLYQRDKTLSGYRVARTSDGMVLRSGSHLHKLSSVIQQHEFNTIDFNKTFSPVYMNENINNKNKMERYSRDRNQNQSPAQSRSVSRSSVYSNSSYGSETGKEVRRTLAKEFKESGREKGAHEESEKGCNKRQKANPSPWSRATSVVSHMLGYPLITMYQMWTSITEMTEMTTLFETTGIDSHTDGYLSRSTTTTYTENKPKRYSDVGTNTDDTNLLIDSVDYGVRLQTEHHYHNHESEKYVTSPSILKSTPAAGKSSWIQRITSTFTTVTDGLDDDDVSDSDSYSTSTDGSRKSKQRVENKTKKGIRERFRGSMCAIWQRIGVPVRDILKLLYSWIYHFIIVDIWVLAKRPKVLLWCLLIPLFLLFLPFFLRSVFSGGVNLWCFTCAAMQAGNILSHSLYNAKSTFLTSFSSFSSPSSLQAETEHHVPQFSAHNTGNFKDRVKQIIFQLQKNQSPQLNAIDIERIVKGVISEELAVLKVDLSRRINEAKGHMDSWQMEQKLKFVTLKDNINLAMTESKEFERKLEDAIAKTSKQTKQDVNLARDKIRLLEEQIQSLGTDIAQLRLEHFEMLGEVKNCCHNDTFFAAVIKSQINDIISKIVAGGGGTGADSHGGFVSWLNSNYAKKEDYDNTIADLKAMVENRLNKIMRQQDANKMFVPSGSSKGSGVSEEYVRFIVDEAIQKFSADKTGMADYALESIGGSIISIRCSVTYYKKTALVSIFGIPLWYASNSPRTVIQPDVYPGQCWAFKGSRGYLVIQLATAVQPTGFTLEHISRLLSPAGNVDSAPKDFSVIGLTNEREVEKGKHLGNYTYNQEGNPVQFFPVQAVQLDFYPIVELRILSNHGNPEYTCLYRFRVHGMPYKK
ncbi:SUN domain-containing protein 2-like isoform X2 [Gigantopelta aegis]|uniref:SUN domain-containing protein 2-like isoform X2 n=1 Tax=Gigantopelta aegis TaxID=1735272 RepID=UPI001B887455|nr:SUN domain-containing protein 2-like isoform X2 [Gigantopelta aegis]